MKRAAKSPRKSPEMLALQRQQLDRRMRDFPSTETPRGGWIRTIREALGMTMAQLGKRLAISPQSLRSLEERERKGAISLTKLREAADALDCELRVAFVPRTSLEETMHRQAARKSSEQRNRLLHTMRLESQEEGVGEVLDEKRAAELWLTQRARRLWD